MEGELKHIRTRNSAQSKKGHLEVKHRPTKKEHKAVKIWMSFFWFLVGFIFSGAFLASFILIYFKNAYRNKIIPGLFIESEYIGGKTKEDVINLFDRKNNLIQKSQFVFSFENYIATISAEEINAGYDSKLISEQSFSLGKTSNIFSNLYIIISSYLNGIYLPPSYKFDAEKLNKVILPIQNQIFEEPIDALFTVTDNRVTAFKESRDGKTIYFEKLEYQVEEIIPELLHSKTPKIYSLKIPIKILKPTTTEEVNNLGIVEVIGEGKSKFVGSIPNRVYNISLAASRINGVLVAPGEVFSFNKNLGDVSKYTGYKEAYIIKDGRTILGDGGGVCQVSTTLFRAILNSGLPIIERHPHSYRVGYYEQDSKPGVDATIYVPTDDLRFKNDTNHHILIQSIVDPVSFALTFVMYGKKDKREVIISSPVITSQTPPPEPLYQDDPNLPKGQEKQVEHAAWGANVYFKRTVTKNGDVIISETINSKYTPWRDVFLRGTKEG